MVLTLVNFALYISALACTCTPVPNSKDGAEDAVNNEIAPVVKGLNKILNIDNKDEKLLQLGEFLGELKALGRKALKAEALLKSHAELEKEKDIAVDDAAFLEFVMHIRSKSEVFKDEMMKHIGFKLDDRDLNSYAKIILEKLENIKVTKELTETTQHSPAQELLHTGKHYRQWILILHFADERASKQLVLLKDLLGRNRQRYHEYAMAMQPLYTVFSKDRHAKLMYVKYVKKANYNKYLERLSDELRNALEIFIRSENTRR